MTEEFKHNSIIPPPKSKREIVYNATRETLKFPEYGRLIQEMVEYALSIENKAERQIYAEAIVDVMIGFNPKMRDVVDFRHKIWDHLAFLSDYKLDIDYPFEITKRDKKRVPPSKLSYPKGPIHFRHYGRLVEKAVKELKDMPEGPQRDDLVQIIGNRMKRNLADWKGDGIQDSKVSRDIAYYTNGQIEPDFTQPGKQLIQIGENRFRTRKNKGLF